MTRQAPVIAAHALAAGLAQAQPCMPDWMPAFERSEPGGPVQALAVFDPDGPGPEAEHVYALHYPFGVSPRRPVIRWTASGWAAVGGDELVPWAPAIPTRSAMVVHDEDGPGPRPASLYIGGAFAVDRDGRISRAVARLEGEAWNHVGDAFTSADDRVYALASFDEDGGGPNTPALYAAGSLVSLGSSLARWDGDSWSDVPHPPFGEQDFREFRALQVWDADGAGAAPAVLAAGWASSTDQSLWDGQETIGLWDGAAWSQLGAGAPNRPGHIMALGAFAPPGQTGSEVRLFATSGANPASGFLGGVAWFDGASWRRVIPSEGGAPESLATRFGRMGLHDADGPGPAEEALFACVYGEPGTPVFRPVSRWDGEAAEPVLSGFSRAWYGMGGGWCAGQADAIVSFDFDGPGPAPPRLVIGGAFTTLGDGPVQDSGLGSYHLLEMSGNFVAAWDGSEWSTLGNGLATRRPFYPSADTLTVFNPTPGVPSGERLYVHGRFNTAGSLAIPLRTSASNSDDSTFRRANARWSAAAGWERAGLDPDVDPRPRARRIRAVAEFPSAGTAGTPTPHVAGSFTQIDGAAVERLARWNGEGWEAFGVVAPATASVNALAVFDPDADGPMPPMLAAAGDFTSVWLDEFSAAGAVAAWNGSRWSTLGFSATPAAVGSLVVFDADGDGPQARRLIAAGDFVLPTALGLARDIAQFEGAAGTWSPLGAGSFTGQVDPAMPVQVLALALFDEDGAGPMAPALYAGGNFLQWTDGMNVLPCRGIARWDGSAWSALTPNLNPPVGCSPPLASPVVRALVSFDPDGPAGPMRASLFVGGHFTEPGGGTQGIGRWDGVGWHALGSGLSFEPHTICNDSPAAYALAVFDDDGPGPNAPALFMGGNFLRAGGRSVGALAKWGCARWELAPPPPPCRGDANGDGAVSFADVSSVLTNWGMMYPGGTGPGDANHDGAVTFSDITTVLENWGVACP